MWFVFITTRCIGLIDNKAKVMDKLNNIKKDFCNEVLKINTSDDLKEFRNKYLSKNGLITQLMQNMKDLSIEEKKTFGSEVNKLKDEATEKVSNLEKEFKNEEIKNNLKKEQIDLTIPERNATKGLIHPISKVIRELQDIFISLGFSLADGPEIEDDWHNFDALNTPPNHPARQMQDSFFMPDGLVLRTQTSAVQIRAMENGKPPFKLISAGKTYRKEFDATHLPMFHQIEGLYVDIGITMANLKSCLIEFFSRFFEVENLPIRFRPSYFPFTTPSVEIDMKCTKEGGKIIKFGEGNDWSELGGAGMVHPNVIRNCGLNPEEYQGFAFGWGIERMAMLKYGISDMRYLYEGDLRFLNHYGFNFFEN